MATEPPPSDSTPAPQEDTTSAEKKRPAQDAPPAAPPAEAANKKPRTVLDAASALFQPGDRIEVQWDIVDEHTSRTRWWGATLLEHDGRRLSDGCHEGIAIRTLDYDAYPEGGFPERSQEDVVFLGKNKLLQLEDGQELDYRKEGGGEVVFYGQEGMRDAVDGVLARAMQNTGSAFQKMDPAMQALVAEKVAKSKEKLLDALENYLETKEDKTLTGQDVPQVIAQAFGNQK